MPPILASDANPWCIAHRGARDEAPENTRAAFEQALAYPIDGIELDVQMSKDGVPVIYHDRTLLRVAGRRCSVADLSFSELGRLDWGRWYGKAFAGEPVLTLDQTLSLLGRRTRLLIEIKSRPVDQASGHAGRLTQKVLGLLADPSYGLSPERIFLLSFDPPVLLTANRHAPQWRCVLNLPEKVPNAVMNWPRRMLDHLWAVDVPIQKLSEPLVRWAHGEGLHVLTYTCNGPRQADKALKAGVDGLLSDRPGWLTHHLNGVSVARRQNLSGKTAPGERNQL